jgi:ABC-type glycerol-3-phosphate transport system permease component
MVILSFQTPEGIAWGQMTAMATIAMLPPMILVLLTQRWMVRGLTMGAVKG